MIDQSIEYYEISGTSARELKLAMSRLGPKGARDHAPWVSSIAVTRWEVAAQADYSSKKGSCAVESFRTRVEIRIVLPRWAGRVPGHPLTERWDAFAEAVAWHEQGHAEHAIQAAREMQERVAALGPAATCKELESAITSTTRSVTDKYRREDSDFDWRRTRDADFDDDETLWLASRGQIPMRRLPPAVPDSELSDTDRRRVAGTSAFESDLKQLSGAADRADAAWRLYVENCRVQIAGAHAGTAGRSWFPHAWNGGTTRAMQTCREAGRFSALADEVKDGICAADERARRAYVYPGTRRELRVLYRLDWDGWDRVCR